MHPLVTAFVVFPTASKASVMSRTSLGSSDISAMPPALSVTGPYASSATIMPAKASIVVAAMAIPNSPAQMYAQIMPPQMTIVGKAVASIETAKPWIIFVACPV